VSAPDRLLGAIGLCRRAGKMICGVDLICTELRKSAQRTQQIKLVLAPADVSDNTKKKLNDKCKFYGVELLAVPYTAVELAAAVGKDAPIGAVAITDAGFVQSVKQHLPAQE
jgi:ribosomal protein L7Ae-like RNA K-turn-binding protein